ncbi:MAG: peptidyl-prolyl cis-trans isomerase [Deferribacteraceae bacterium]|nr:peptidyl-prolyl cis-trans isomerase [Deferribacteraceae bacterium]
MTTGKSEAEAGVFVTMKTSYGTIQMELYPDKAPETVKNFLSYVESGFYNGTIFHRIIPNFMIQGGGFTVDMVEKSANKPIKNEADNGLKNDRGTIAMARTNDPHSATAQFFINTVDNTFLNYKASNVQGYGYAVFGKVIDGMDVVDKIAKVKTQNVKHFENVPEKPVLIAEVKVSFNSNKAKTKEATAPK